MLLWVLVFEIKHTALISIDNVGVHIFVISFMLSSIVHMHMTMQKIFWLIFFHQGAEDPKALMRQIPSVVQLISGRMRHQDIKPTLPEKLKPQFPHPLLHLLLRILMGPRLVTHRTAQTQNPHPLMDINLIFYTGAALRRYLLIFFVMISMDIEHRDGGEGTRKER